MNETPRWGLPLLAMGQAQKEITHNEALISIDSWLHVTAISRRLGEPPEAPKPGDAYIVGASARHDWHDRQGQLAVFDGFGWTFAKPREGCLAWVIEETMLVVFSELDWRLLAGLPTA